MSAPSVTPMQIMFADVANELASTRRLLERVPDGKNDWQPHDKSMQLGRLATHLAELPRLASLVLTTDELDWAKSPYTPSTFETTAERLAQFDELSAKMQDDLSKADWPDLMQEWTMRRGEQVIIKSSKGVLIRSAGMSHMTHHRAQLGVYLRLLGVDLPGTYGPSADQAV